MKETLINFETAKLAKEKFFNIYQPIQYSYAVNPTTEYNYTENQCKLFNDTYYAPTQSLLQKWLREEHRIDIIVKPWSGNSVNTKTYAADVCVFGTSKYLKLQKTDIYEHALEIGLQEALKLI